MNLPLYIGIKLFTGNAAKPEEYANRPSAYSPLTLAQNSANKKQICIFVCV